MPQMNPLSMTSVKTMMKFDQAMQMVHQMMIQKMTAQKNQVETPRAVKKVITSAQNRITH